LKFAVDVTLPGMLHGKILRSPHPHAQIKRIDTSKAEALPGVNAVLTHKDIPQKDWVGVWVNYRGPVLSDRVRFVGDEVAAVAAKGQRTAEKALGLIEVDYELLPAVFDLDEAMKANSPQVRPDGNVRKPSVIEWGDVEKGFKDADVVVEHKTRLGCQQQAPLGRNAYVASWAGDKVTIWTSTQTPCELRDIVAEFLEVPSSKVRVIALPVGPSFGCWWVNNVDLIAVFLAKKAGKPVKLELTQEETFAYVKRRHIEASQGRLGVKKDGTFTAIDVRHNFDNGAYGDKFDVYQSVADLWGGRCPNGKFEMYGVSTNLVTAGCMRGVGDLTMNFCVEQLIDKAAEEIQMDPIQIRTKNHTRTGELLRSPIYAYKFYPGIQPPRSFTLSSSTLEECLNTGAKAIGWREKWRGWKVPAEVAGPKKRGIGVATACHICGLNYGGSLSAVVRVNTDGSVSLLVNLGRQGQGSESTQAQIAAEELGVPYENVTVVSGDTDACPWSQGSTASTAAHLTGLATKAAAADAKRQILELAAETLDARPEDLNIKDGVVHHKADQSKKLPMREIVARPIPKYLAPPIIIGRAMANVTNDVIAKHFAAHFVELEVDTETGQVEILKYVAAHDSGKIINPGICENQVIGGVFLGCGFSLTEDLQMDPKTGRVLNPNFTDYKVLGARDLPDPEVIFAEVEDPIGPFGAKGIGEAPVCP
ncbi:MAG: xanthine dehydrogenase family protein molybdopterin-binding subunit, partial [Candidatus Bathyarchaeia archaeon]